MLQPHPQQPPQPTELFVAQTRLLLAAISPLEFARRFLNFYPDEAQGRVLRKLPDFRQVALNCSRQWGKSTIAAVWIVHRLYFTAGCTVLIVGPSGRQSGETLRKVKSFLAVLGTQTRGDGVNRQSAVLPNGSRVVALPAREDTVRGFSAVSMLIIDEAARVSDEIYDALMPSLAVGNGDVILLSTPQGARGEFHRVMTEGERWLRHTGPVTECTRIPAEFLERERARGETLFRQEYLCEFVENGTHLLTETLVKKTVKVEEASWKHI